MQTTLYFAIISNMLSAEGASITNAEEKEGHKIDRVNSIDFVANDGKQFVAPITAHIPRRQTEQLAKDEKSTF